jgi:hypothetical protein
MTLNLYTSVKLSAVTEKQREKFESSVKAKPLSCHAELHVPKGLKLRPKRTSVQQWLRSERKRAPIRRVDGSVDTEVESDISLKAYLISCGYHQRDIQFISRYRKQFAAAFECDEFHLSDVLTSVKSWVRRTGPQLYEEMNSTIVSGKIGLIQERGAKLRAVANPFRHYQAVLSPLGHAVFDVLKQLPWDCTHEQEKGVDFVQDALKAGSKVFSVDLSDATNLFPLEVQLTAIENLINESNLDNHTQVTKEDLHEQLRIFAELSRGNWLYKLPSDGYIQWTKGQPLGLFPSFAIFAATHGFLVRQIEVDLGLNNTFRILGDDIVITNESVYHRYRAILDQLGCQVSESKSLVSDKLGEFAGKLITADGVISINKFSFYGNSNPLGPLTSLGFPGMKFIPKSVRRKVAAIAAAPEPVGLGLNPRGLSLKERMPDEVIHYWYSFDRHIPSNRSRYNRDARESYLSFWEGVCIPDEGVGKPFICCQKDITRILPDRAYDPWISVFIDHVRKNNRESLFPEQILRIALPDESPPFRGDPRKKTGEIGIWKLITSYFRLTRKTVDE